MLNKDRLTNKQFQAMMVKYPTSSIRFRDIGGMRVEILSLVPAKRGGISVTSLGFIQLPKDKR